MKLKISFINIHTPSIVKFAALLLALQECESEEFAARIIIILFSIKIITFSIFKSKARVIFSPVLVHLKQKIETSEELRSPTLLLSTFSHFYQSRIQ